MLKLLFTHSVLRTSGTKESLSQSVNCFLFWNQYRYSDSKLGNWCLTKNRWNSASAFEPKSP